MQKKFDKYWENSNLIHTLACVFDPRCKLAFVKFCFRAAYGDATDIYNKNLESVHSALKEFYKDYENVIGNIDRTTSSGSPQVEGRIYGKRKFEMRFSQFQSQNQRVMSRNSELDTYLEKELVSFHEENFDILQW
jgi:outer membrane lipoprotein-sorting protein